MSSYFIQLPVGRLTVKMPPAKRRRHKGSFLFDRNPDFSGSVGIEDCVITASRPIFVNSIITEYPIRVNAFPLPPRYRMTIEFLCELDKQSLP